MSSIAEEISRLNELRESGAMSQEEFDETKAALLEKERTQAPLQDANGMTKEKEINMWGMILHLSQFCGFIVPMAGLVAPIVIWQIKKGESPLLDFHGRVVANWILSALIYGLVAIPLCFILIGFLLLFAVGVLCIVFPIMGAVKANNGEVWPYPLSIKFFALEE